MRYSLVLLLSINLINYIDRYILAAVEPLIRKDLLSADDKDAKFWMGTLSTAFLITYMVTAPLFGYLGDRTRRWTVVGIGVLLWTLATGACGLAESFWMLLAMRVLVGLGEAAWGPIAPTIISDMYPTSKRGWVLSWFYVAIPVGSALGYILGGGVANWKSWHWAFFVVVPPGILLGLLALFRPEPRRGGMDGVDGGAARVKFSWPLVGALVRNRSFRYNTLGMTAMTFAVGGMSFWMPSYIHERLGGGTDEAGRSLLAKVNMIFGAITVVAGLSGTLIGGYVCDKLRTRIRGAYAAISGATMLVVFPLFLLVLFMPFPWAWVFMFFAMFCIFFSTGPTNAIIANVTHPSIRATAFAVNIFTIHALGDAISPSVIGLVADRTHSMNTAFMLVGLAIIVGGVLWMLGAKFLDRDTVNATNAAKA